MENINQNSQITLKEENTPQKLTNNNNNINTPLSTNSKTGRSKSVVLTSTPLSASAREAARISKLKSTEEKRRKTFALKEKWAKEKQEKLELFAKRKQEELKAQQKIEQILSLQRKKDLEKKREIEKQKLNQEKESLQLSLEAHRLSKQELERQAKERRRRSVLINKEILLKSKQREAKLRQKQKEDEDSLLTSRRIDFLAVREKKEIENELRRQSVAKRVEDGFRKAETERELQRLEKEEEIDLFNTRREVWLDEKSYHEHQKERMRESLAGRLDTWRVHKQVDELQRQENQKQQEKEFELKKQCWLDFKEQEVEKQKRDRLSLMWRRDKFREEKDIEEEMRRKREDEIEIERQLLQQEYEDVLRYEAEQENLRRQSLAYRLDAAARDRDYLAGQDANKHAVIAHEMELRRQDFLDLKSFREGLEEERRKSIARSLEKSRQDRAYMDGLKTEELERLHQEHLIHEEEHKDIENYLANQRNLERQEIASRIETSKRNKEKDLMLHRELLDKMHEEYEDRRENWKSLQNYQINEIERSRKSVCLRLESWKTLRMKREKERAYQQLVAEHDAALKQEDYRAIQEKKMKEKLDEKLANSKRMLF